MNEIFCTQCGHDPLLQADNDRRNREELEAAKAEIKHLTEQIGKLAHLANEKNAVVISEMYIADWDVIRAETAQARTQLAVANARIAELEGARAAVCKWYPDDDCYWEGTCGVAWSLEDGTPRENDMNFCPKCGRKLVELPAAPEVEE